MNNDYEKQAQDFLTKTNTTIKIEYLKTDKYFDDDKEVRDIYQITMIRNNRHFTFTFGNSIQNSGRFIRKDYGTQLSNGILINDQYKAPARKDYGDDWHKNINFKIPTAYDILACLQKYEVGSFEDFCNEFGYDADSRKAEKIYDAVKNEYTQLCTLFNDIEMQDLQEIN